MNTIITKIKDKLLRHTILVRSRKMFYIENNSEIIEPEFCYKNMTHREWFSNIGLDVSDKFLLRGYYRNGLIMLYTGLDHDIKYFPCVEVIVKIYKYFLQKGYLINKIGLGSYHSKWRTLIGKDWKEKYTLDIQDVRKLACVSDKNSKDIYTYRYNKETNQYNIIKAE